MPGCRYDWRIRWSFSSSATPTLEHISRARSSLEHTLMAPAGHIGNYKNGDPNPKKWDIVLESADAGGGVREVEVHDGRIGSEGAPRGSVAGSAEGATIDTARLNLDSSGAYALASHTAQTSHTKFATVDYTLRTDERGEPVWIVTLVNKSSRPVGTINIGATRGTVRRTEGMFAGTTMEDVETEYDAEERGMLTGIESRIKRAFHRTQEEARGMFERVKRSFSDFINRE